MALTYLHTHIYVALQVPPGALLSKQGELEDDNVDGHCGLDST